LDQIADVWVNVIRVP